MDGIEETLRDQTILVTGATGFMGKVLIEKLLRTIDFKHLYLMIRPRKGLSSQQRIESMLSKPIFAEVKSSINDIKSKISLIDSDLSVNGLGLTRQDAGILASQVNIVFHAAANVKFDEPLKDAYNINVRGTKQLLDLALKMQSLKAFIHVSTAYSQSYMKRIDEKLYDFPIRYDKLEHIMESLDDSVIDYMTPKLLGKWPNTYCFTKAMAETVLADFSPKLPLAIFRPGIVSSAHNEPVVGWVDNFYGSNGLVAGAYSGVWHVALIDGSVHANLVPVDMADNALIAVAAKLVHSHSENRKEITVYNYVSQDNPITYNQKKLYLEKFGFDLISIKAIWVYYLILTKRKWLYFLLCIIFHYIPAITMDIVMWIAGIKAPIGSFWKVYRTIDKASSTLQYFTSRNWDWETTNTRQLWTDLSKKDKENFRFDMSTLDWEDYFKKTIIGMRVYLFKDDMSSLPKALSRYSKMRKAHQVIVIIISLIIFKVILSFTFVNNYIYQLIGLQ